MFPPRLFLVYCGYFILAFLLAKLIWRFWQPKECSHVFTRNLMWLLIIGQALFYYFTYMALHHNFLNGAVDMATISQSLWNIIHGQTPYETIVGTHALRVHFSPLWYVVAQVFRLWPSIDWLVMLSTFSVAVGGYIVYALAEKVLESEWLGLALGVAYLLNPYLQMAQLAAAHAESFDSPLILLSLYTLQRRQWKWFWVAMVAALTGKEDVGLYYAGLGVYIWLGLAYPGRGLIVACLGLTWSILAYALVMPLFGPDTQNLISRFNLLGQGTYIAILKNIIFHPWILITPLLQWEKFFSIFYLLAQTAFSALLAGWAMLPMGIALWLKSITNYVAMYNYWDHYSLHLLPFLYFASLIGIKHWLQAPQWHYFREKFHRAEASRKIYLAFCLLLLSLLLNLEQGNNPLSRKFRIQTYRITEHSRLGEKLLQKIPSQASVLAQERIAPHLSLRREIYTVTAYHHWQIGDKPWYEPDYVIFDLKSAQSLSYCQAIEQTADYFFSCPDYRVLAEADGWVLFHKQTLAAH